MTTPARRRALVTGAARGIGRATAERLLADGYAVAIADNDGEEAERTAAALDPDGARMLALEADVADSAAATAMVATTVQRFGGLDVLVNNAGFAAPADTASLPDAEWQAFLDVNLSGPLWCARAAQGLYDLDEMSSRVPLGRLGETGELAGTIAFLAGADAGYITGQTLVVDGGLTVDGRT